MSGMEREYIRDRTLEVHESARLQGEGYGAEQERSEECSSVSHLLTLAEASAAHLFHRWSLVKQPPVPRSTCGDHVS